MLKIALKCMSMRVVLDLLNQILNVDAMWSFHCRIWHSWNVEVSVFLVGCTVELVVRVKWCNVTMFCRNKFFFHYVCAWAAWLHRLPCSIVSMLNTNVFRQFHRFPRSEEPSSLCKRFSSISWVRDVLPLSTKKCSVSSDFPDRSQIGLGLHWVGLESLTRGASPKDCWTSFPTGCCLTAEPNSSFLLVQSWSCRNEIFGGGRGDMYAFSYETSPVLSLTTFGRQ